MGFLDTFRKKTAAPNKKSAKASAAEAKTSSPVEQEASASVVSQKKSMGNELSFRLLRKPHVSEKAAYLAQSGTYVFDVPVDAEKVSIKKAVESLYQVKVSAVRTIRHEGKPVTRGRRGGERQRWKKALVTLVKGQTIDIYEGV